MKKLILFGFILALGGFILVAIIFRGEIIPILQTLLGLRAVRESPPSMQVLPVQNVPEEWEPMIATFPESPSIEVRYPPGYFQTTPGRTYNFLHRRDPEGSVMAIIGLTDAPKTDPLTVVFLMKEWLIDSYPIRIGDREGWRGIYDQSKIKGERMISAINLEGYAYTLSFNISPSLTPEETTKIETEIEEIYETMLTSLRIQDRD